MKNITLSVDEALVVNAIVARENEIALAMSEDNSFSPLPTVTNELTITAENDFLVDMLADDLVDCLLDATTDGKRGWFNLLATERDRIDDLVKIGHNLAKRIAN